MCLLLLVYLENNIEYFKISDIVNNSEHREQQAQATNDPLPFNQNTVNR